MSIKLLFVDVEPLADLFQPLVGYVIVLNILKCVQQRMIWPVRQEFEFHVRPETDKFLQIPTMLQCLIRETSV